MDLERDLIYCLCFPPEKLAVFNFNDGFIYAGGGNGSFYRIDPETFEAELLFTPTPERRSRLSSLVKGADNMAYGVTGRDGQRSRRTGFLSDP